MQGNTRLRRRGVAVLVGLAAVLGPLSTTPQPAIAAGKPADVVRAWNANAMATIVTAGQGPTVAFLHLAMVQGAVYDAVNGIKGGYDPYLGVPSTADRRDSAQAAAATAAHDVLVALYAPQEANLDSLYQASLDAIPDGPAKTGGIEVGQQAAAAMLTERTGDGRFTAFPVDQGDGPGEWRSTAFIDAVPVVEPAPWVAIVRPFLVPDATAFRTDGPNELTSAAYAADFAEVEEIGSLTSSTRTADQTDAAKFWQGNGAGMWNAIIRQLADTRDLNVSRTARLLAMTNMVAADAIIGCWEDKYYWNFWRPVTAIHEANTDGNPATTADPDWTPLLVTTPPFPEHPSGHSCVSSAIGRTLQNFFHTDEMEFNAYSAFSLTTRSFTSFSQAVREVLNARVWGGIHFRTADVQGAVIGRKVAHYSETHYFQRVG
jgi:hypothetical protein